MPTRRLFDLRHKAASPTYSQQVAAVGAWVLGCLAQRGTALENWSEAQDQEVLKQQQKQTLDEHNLDARWGRLGLQFDGHWTLHNGDWDAYFDALLAVPHGRHLQGAAAQRALTELSSASTRLRIMTFEFLGAAGAQPERGIIAAVAENDALYLFDPTHGLYQHVPASFLGASASWFASTMRRHGRGRPLNAHCWLVSTTDVFFAWLGPPARPRQGDGNRPDLLGPLSLAAATSGDKHPPKLKFFCLERYRQQFAAAVPSDVQVDSFESHLPAINDQGHNQLQAPNYRDLHASVAAIISESIRPPRDVRALVNAKNVWSLYCLWRYGGYHLDTGVERAPGGPQIALPRPKRFSAMSFTNRQEDVRLNFRHVTGQFDASGLRAAALVGSGETQLEFLLLDDLHLVPSRPGTFQITGCDVGLMRSPRHDPGIERALRFYILLWFRIRERRGQGVALLTQREPLLKVYRDAIISAAITGLVHPGADGDGEDLKLVRDPVPSQPERRFFAADPSATFEPATLGLRKTGESSHRN